MFTKYGDATYTEKTAETKVSSSKQMKECCRTAATTTKAGVGFPCPECGNDLFVAEGGVCR